jgi:beta-fructofuranosidase
MKNWEFAGQFNMVWDRMCECPDIFKMGDYWYLIYSEAYRAPWSRKVKYMMAKTYDDLKACFNDPGANWPKDGKEGVLDSRAFYAGKTASNGTDRLIWGWCPKREGATIFDKNVNVGADGEPAWAGALVCHKIIQHADGTLTLGAVPAIANKYSQAQNVNVMASNGYSNGSLSGDDAYVLYNRLGDHNHISFTVTTGNNWDKFGVSLVRGTDSEKYYTMVVNPENENWRKINFEEEGENGIGFVRGIDSYGFDRPADNVYKVDIYTDNSVMVMYINDNVCYTNRIYGIQKNCWSINNYGGSITISDVKVTQY